MTGKQAQEIIKLLEDIRFCVASLMGGSFVDDGKFATYEELEKRYPDLLANEDGS